jgi:uncharacterized protein
MSFDTRTHGEVVALDEKALRDDGDVWTFTGYASIFNSTDLGNDIVMPGAFQKSLRDHGNPLLLFQHKHDECPVGTIVEAREDKRGLWVKGELPKDDAFCRDRLVPQLKRRGLKGMSIGYRTLQSERRKEDGVRLLKELRLYECSFVSMPMHPEAGLEVIKADETTPKEVKAFLASMADLTAAITEIAEAKREADELAASVWGFDAHLTRALARIDTIRNTRPTSRGRPKW